MEIGEVAEKCVYEVMEGEESRLMNKEVHSEDDAYNLYNRYAYVIGFSIRKHHQKYRADRVTLYTKQFCCWKEGYKVDTSNENKAFTKIDFRTGCKAKVQFDIDDKGVWRVTRHDMIHNHDFVATHQRHYLKSHRQLSGMLLDFITNMVNNGVGVSTAVRTIRNEVGGSPVVGFTTRDAYNAVAKEKAKKIEGSDSSTLIGILKNRSMVEENFYYDFQLDEKGRLCNFFFRDGIMRDDYEKFGDLVVHDTTYRTNKYDLICGPFIGMNHHNCNVMFGIGFILNETTESFIWLFKTFLMSMGGSQPKTIMTDQCSAMSAAISIVFQQSHHRLCVWHIEKNSKRNIGGLRKKKDFTEYFNYCLKHVETEAEFNFYWNEMMEKYQCRDNLWLKNLFHLRYKWCPAFSKDIFSGGILSSQRSETTNKSVSHRLVKTASLCDFYRMFVNVVDDWRRIENGEDFNCVKGCKEMALFDIGLLMHAREVYTIQIYLIFEESYKRGLACHQFPSKVSGNNILYVVWQPRSNLWTGDMIRHVVTYNTTDHTVRCTCKRFSEIGVLCRHCLRIYMVHCVERIPDRYILKRWHKEAIKNYDWRSRVSSTGGGDVASMFVWRTHAMRKFNDLVSSCGSNCNLQKVVDDLYELGRKGVADRLRLLENPITQVDSCDQIGSEVSNSQQILDPSGSRKKGERNKRKKSVIEAKGNALKGRNKNCKYAAIRTKEVVQNCVQGEINQVAGAGFIVHPFDGSQSLQIATANNIQSIFSYGSQFGDTNLQENGFQNETPFGQAQSSHNNSNISRTSNDHICGEARPGDNDGTRSTQQQSNIRLDICETSLCHD